MKIDLTTLCKITEFKYITDMAAFRVSDTIDVKSEHPSCELCGEDFKNSANKVLDKNSHLFGHFREDIMKDLKNNKAVFSAIRRELGDSWKIPPVTESPSCKLF